MSTVVQASKKKAARRGLPILGLIFAVALMAFSYGISSPLVKYGEAHNAKLNTSVDNLRTNLEGRQWYVNNEKYHKNKGVEIITAIVLWFVIMALAMFVVAAALFGTDPEKEAWKNMGPSPANKKATIKQMKKDLKVAKKLAKEQKKAQGKK
jgi:amino acid transporter